MGIVLCIATKFMTHSIAQSDQHDQIFWMKAEETIGKHKCSPCAINALKTPCGNFMVDLSECGNPEDPQCVKIFHHFVQCTKQYPLVFFKR